MNWHFLNPDPKLVNRLKKEFKSSEIIARVLANRGIESVASSKDFFNPQLNQLNNPFDMQDMDIATDRIIPIILAIIYFRFIFRYFLDIPKISLISILTFSVFLNRLIINQH